MRYIARPFVIEAWKVGTDSRPHWIDAAMGNHDIVEYPNNRYTIQNDNVIAGYFEACEGQWIIRGIKGEFYVCDNDVFEKSYRELGALSLK